MILEKLIQILSEQLDLDPNSLSADTAIVEDLGADSLDVVEMLMAVQDEFDVEIPDDEIENFKTIGDMADYVAKVK